MSDSERIQPLNLIEDKPVPGFWVDELDLKKFSTVVAGAALGTRGPFTIGVFADWGLGKTSVMRQAKSLVDKDPGDREVITVWFNAWQYEKEEHPIVPLLATIVRAVELHLAERRNAKKAVKTGWESIAKALRAVAYGFSSKAKINMPGFGEIEAGFVAKEMIDRYEKLRESDPLLDRSLYFNAFEMLNSIANPPDHKEGDPLPKIVVFIDDLDRCLPDQGLRLLESMKLVLSQPGFVFVLGVDPRILEGYLEKRYTEEFNVADYRSSGTSYLDKMVQLPLHIPPHNDRFKSYVERLLNRPEISSSEELSHALHGVKDILAVGSNYNPRSLVRFVNNLLVDQYLRRLLGKASGEEFIRIAATSRSLQLHLPARLYRRLVVDNELCYAIQQASEGFPLEKRIDDPNKRQKEVLAAIAEHEFLVDLLDDKFAGRFWLQNHALRKEVDEFLQVSREVSDRLSQDDHGRVIYGEYDVWWDSEIGEISIDGEPIQGYRDLSSGAIQLLQDFNNEHWRDVVRPSLRPSLRVKVSDSGAFVQHISEIVEELNHPHVIYPTEYFVRFKNLGRTVSFDILLNEDMAT